MISATLDANAVARGLLSASHACDKDQTALYMRLMQGAECILEQHAMLLQREHRIKQLEDQVSGMPPQDPLPSFLKRQAE